MAPLLGSELTSFTLDNMGRFLCNTLQEAHDSTTEVVGGRKRDFDVIIIGGGTFGSVIAEHLFRRFRTSSGWDRGRDRRSGIGSPAQSSLHCGIPGRGT